MKIVQINAVCGSGSTGKICAAVSDILSAKGIENYILYGSGSSSHPAGVKYASVGKAASAAARLSGNWGFEGRAATEKLLAQLDRIQPDVVHLHNLHQHGCHLGMLFDWLRRHQTKVFWTFHDCWAFTGYCTYFDSCDCSKWQTRCTDCPQRRTYSQFFDRSARWFDLKKALFEQTEITVVTPSQWLKNVFLQSPMSGGHPVRVINNGIDLGVFSPAEEDVLREYHDQGKYIVLGVAAGWEDRKGLRDFLSLSERLDDRFLIVLAGDTKTELPSKDNMLAVGRTDTAVALARLYSAADVFVNPTREDNFPTVNIEALACGTPVLTYPTGGSPEIIDATCGNVVPRGDVQALAAEIERVCVNQPYAAEACVHRAARYDQHKKFQEYVSLYKSLL